MAGEVASLLLSRMTVPVLYYTSHRRRQAKSGEPQTMPLVPAAAGVERGPL
jgi:hypothetical protein